MNSKVIILMLAAMTALPFSLPAGNIFSRSEALSAAVQKDRHDRHKDRHRGHKNRYVVIDNDVFYRGVKIKDASAGSFTDLGYGYAKDAFNVYYKGKELPDATLGSFVILTDGYAKDAFKVYYKGKEVSGATSSSFKVMSDGYAKDAFDTYYRGRKAD